MAESAINRRKSQLFLNNISPVTDTYNELIKKKLKRGKFLETKTGIIKIAGMDMVVILVLSATTIITSTVTLINCQGSNVDKVSQSCGMAGGVTLFVSCGAIFLMFRYVEDEDLPENKKRKPNENTGIDPRKSVFA
ncbi:uncharacterized protein [Diabrotica undecimpunctata]|uniref:uncharacterized protein isoform X2 n=1 Tax=Diabrotica undecimpunctata TaxID=50387 RepID=UPI003B641C6F